VLTAPDGAAGLTLFRDKADEIRLVMTDIMMPVLDGTQVIREIRQLRGGTPIIAMSGSATNRTELEATPGGRLRFLGKPFVVEQIPGLVRELRDEAPAP
jgi:CheY-like chemotaxis protein